MKKSAHKQKAGVYLQGVDLAARLAHPSKSIPDDTYCLYSCPYNPAMHYQGNYTKNVITFVCTQNILCAISAVINQNSKCSGRILILNLAVKRARTMVRITSLTATSMIGIRALCIPCLGVPRTSLNWQNPIYF